jgi:hypothetical protein
MRNSSAAVVSNSYPLPFGVIAMFISAFTIPATANVDVIRLQVACAVLWVALRVAHTVVYALALQPWV